MVHTKIRPQVLLHICCAPDSTTVVERLREHYRVTGYFHNPNIAPPQEYERRSREACEVARRMGFPIIIPAYHPESWYDYIKGLEDEPEKGRRCELCFRFNLRAAAGKTRELKIPDFTTTLTISPHKDSQLIIRIGKEAAKEFGVNYLDFDFKKKHGFQRSLELSRQFSLYRQNYCGCRFSMRNEKSS
ncbi:MAG: epoxyqueuosine reductase QueH [Candidatus Aminicenantes bacterium]